VYEFGSQNWWPRPRDIVYTHDIIIIIYRSGTGIRIHPSSSSVCCCWHCTKTPKCKTNTAARVLLHTYPYNNIINDDLPTLYNIILLDNVQASRRVFFIFNTFYRDPVRRTVRPTARPHVSDGCCSHRARRLKRLYIRCIRHTRYTHDTTYNTPMYVMYNIHDEIMVFASPCNEPLADKLHTRCMQNLWSMQYIL